MNGCGLVVAFGGDGTVSEIAAGLLSARESGSGDTDLGIIHRGTGGDFRRTLDLPSDVARAAKHIRDSPARLIDAGRVFFAAPDGGTAARTFINVASFGFSSAVAARANRSSKILGAKVAFLGATVKTLVDYQNAEVMLELDGAPPIRRTLMLAAIGNGRYFGGGMKICPGAKLDTGFLSLVMVGDLGKVKVLANMPRLFAGTHLAMDDVHEATIRSLRVTPVDPRQVIPIELDGETPGQLPATFEVIPRALRVRF
jgi:diacylglycerol kinase (ATP)